MAVPARNVSKTRQRTRRAHAALRAKAEAKCSNCGAIIKPHRVCKACGEYKGKKIIKEQEDK